MRSLAIERIEVGASALEARVRVPECVPARTCAVPGLVERATGILPGLRRHRCDNGTSHGVLGELANTDTTDVREEGIIGPATPPKSFARDAQAARTGSGSAPDRYPGETRLA
jgi:hypothetical protein